MTFESCFRRPADATYRRVPAWDHPAAHKTAVPFSVDDPLIFHVITSIPSGEKGERIFLEMVRGGVELASPARTGRSHELMFPVDIAAGDGRYLFLSALNTFRLSFSPGEIAVAFDARALWKAQEGDPAFRVHDLESYYDAVLHDDEGDDDEGDVDEYVDVDPFLLTGSLRCVAKAGTQRDPEGAWRLLDLYVRLAAGGAEASEVDPSPWLPSFNPIEINYWCPEAASLEQAWVDLFRPDLHSLTQRVWGGDRELNRKSPEILYAGTIPLCCAVFWRNASGVWAPLPDDSCAEGWRTWIRRREHALARGQ